GGTNGPFWMKRFFCLLSSGLLTPGGAGADRPDEQLRNVDDLDGLPGLAGGLIGSSGPRASGRRENRMFTGASPMCRCLEYAMTTRDASTYLVVKSNRVACDAQESVPTDVFGNDPADRKVECK